MSTGHQLQEPGAFPATWQVAPLSREIWELEAGVSVNSDGEGLLFSGFEGAAVLRTSAVSGGKFFPDESKSIARRDLSRARVTVRAGTILVSRMNTPNLVGECGYVERDYPNLYLPDRLWMTRKRSGSNVSIKWLSYLLSSVPYRIRIKEIATGTSGSMKNISKDAFLAMLIPYPTPDEQLAIARVLSDVDAMINALERFIDKKRGIKQAAMQQLLVGRSRLPGFGNQWETRPVGRAGNVLVGKALYARGPGRLRPYLRTKNVRDGRIDLDDVLEMPFTDPEFGRYQLRHGDVLLNEGQSLELVGRCAMYRDELGSPCAMQNQLLRFRANAGTSSSFAEHLFRFCQQTGVFAAISTQTTSVAHLGSVRFRNLQLQWPATLDEQDAIAGVLSDMDAEIEALERRRDKTKLIKQGMMQELLTGRTRLV